MVCAIIYKSMPFKGLYALMPIKYTETQVHIKYTEASIHIKYNQAPMHIICDNIYHFKILRCSCEKYASVL
jgi:hypothetical protein